MALPAASTFEVQTGGNDTNGGGFVTGAAGTDYSQVAAKRTATGTDDSTTDVVAIGTSTITSATAAFAASIVGNIISLSGGTGTLAQTWRQVVSRTNATTIVLDSAVAAGTGITMNVGGALASIGGAGLVTLQSGNTIWIKAGSYTIASATQNIATGIFNKNLTIRMEGYQTTRGDLGTPPVLTAAAISSFTVIRTNGSGSYVANIKVDCNSRTASRAFEVFGTIYKCIGINFTSQAFAVASVLTSIQCLAQGGTGTAFGGGTYFNCVAQGVAGTGFDLTTTQGVAVNCIAYGCTGLNGFGFTTNVQNASLFNCVAYGNSKDGFNCANNGSVYVNCIAESNTENGFDLSSNPNANLYNCAAFSNTAGDFNLGTGQVTNYNSVVGGASFFVNAASGNFALNNTGGAGATARATGIPGIFPLALTTGYLDRGAAQHPDPAPSGGGESSSVF